MYVVSGYVGTYGSMYGTIPYGTHDYYYLFGWLSPDTTHNESVFTLPTHRKEKIECAKDADYAVDDKSRLIWYFSHAYLYSFFFVALGWPLPAATLLVASLAIPIKLPTEEIISAASSPSSLLPMLTSIDSLFTDSYDDASVLQNVVDVDVLR